MLPEMPSTMLGHERPPRRARPDDPGQPGAGDARGRSDAARSAAGPDTDSGGGAAITYGITIAATDERAQFYGHGHALPDVNAPAGRYPYADGCLVIKHPRGGSVFVPAADAGTAPAPSKSLNPDSDPAT
jgi:hypothetical protein